MDQALKQSLWKQFGASIDMLENAIKLCPDEFWEKEPKFWYMSFHTLFFLDLYLTPDPRKFSPPKPFTLSEFDDKMPERRYTREEILTYLQMCKEKCRQSFATMTDEIANMRWTDGYKNLSFLELHLYNMRHVQHHAAQLNLLLRQGINDAPKWVRQAKGDL